MRLWVYGRPIF